MKDLIYCRTIAQSSSDVLSLWNKLEKNLDPKHLVSPQKVYIYLMIYKPQCYKFDDIDWRRNVCILICTLFVLNFARLELKRFLLGNIFRANQIFLLSQYLWTRTNQCSFEFEQKKFGSREKFRLVDIPP